MKKQIIALGLTGLIGLGGFGLLTNKSFADSDNKLKTNTTVSQGISTTDKNKDALGKKDKTIEDDAKMTDTYEIKEKGDSTLGEGVDKNDTEKDVAVYGEKALKGVPTLGEGVNENEIVKDVVVK